MRTASATVAKGSSAKTAASSSSGALSTEHAADEADDGESEDEANNRRKIRVVETIFSAFLCKNKQPPIFDAKIFTLSEVDNGRMFIIF